jgi:hydroxymethylglutaryl-CoA lyase
MELSKMGVSILALSDTIGSSEPGVIRYLFGNLIKEFPDVEFGAHLHTTPETAPEKIEAAWSSGCRRFDGAINGFGGCPMAKDELVGNMPTERLLEFFESRNLPTGINKKYFQEAVEKAAYTFPVLN